MFTLLLPCSFYHSLHTVTPSLCGSSTFGSPTHITHHPLILISEKREKPEFERRNLKWSSCFTYTYICIIFFCMSHLLRETFNPHQSFPKPVYFYFHPSFLLNWMEHIAIFLFECVVNVIKKEIEKKENHRPTFKFDLLFPVTEPIKISEFPSNHEERFSNIPCFLCLQKY